MNTTEPEDNFPFEESDDLIRYPEIEGDIVLRNTWYGSALKRYEL